MREIESVIERIKRVKVRVECNQYRSPETLQEDFMELSQLIWKDIEVANALEADLSQVSAIHKFLIKEVLLIHRLEEDVINEAIFQANINLRHPQQHLNDGKRASEIYYFDSEDFEYFFVGDLHSDTISLQQMLYVSDFFESIIHGGNRRFIFLGDYVDRGKAHIKMIEYLLLLKYIFPENIYLLRGNHDGGSIEADHMKLCVGREKGSIDDIYFVLYTSNLASRNATFSDEVVKRYLDFFNSLCTLALLKYKGLTILAVHGGIPRPGEDSGDYYDYLHSFSDLTNETIVDHNQRSIRHNMFWSDPDEAIAGEVANSARFKFFRNHFDSFTDKLGIDLLLRGHEAEQNGYKEYFDRRLITLFSSGMILNEHNENINTETAYQNVKPKILHLNGNREVLIVDLNME